MVKIKMGQIISEARGSIAGFTFSRNTYGAYGRQKVSPINPQTAYQIGVRNDFTSMAVAWSGLTDAQRLQWNTQAVNWTRTNVFGDNVPLTGFNLFMRLNLNLLLINQTTIDIPPVHSDVFTFDSASLAISLGGGTGNITFSPAIPAGTHVALFATAPTSPGKNFVKSEYRLIKIMDSADVSPFDAAGDYVAKFGAVGAIGQKVFIKMKPILDATGQPGGTISTSAIVAA